MAGDGVGRVFGGLGGVFRQNQRISSCSQPLEAFLFSGSSSSFLGPLGSSSMVSFGDVYGGKRSEMSSFRSYDLDENGDEEFDDYFHQPEKKRRLTVEQVKFLEKSFDLENKLEPERKVQLAKELGLQPRQVAIWFQNRRARWKTKQLEKDFDALQASYNSLKADYDNVFREKEKLQAEVIHFTEKLNLKQKEKGGHSDSSNNIFDQFETEERKLEDGRQISILPSESEQQEDDHLLFSTTVTISDVPECTDSSRFANVGGFCAAIEDLGDHSDISQDDQDYLIRQTLLPSSSQSILKIEDSESCKFDAPLLWPYWDVNLRI